jgi:hypothetical protein
MGLFSKLFSGNKATQRAENPSEGSFLVQVCDSYFDAEMALMFAGALGENSPALRLSVLPVQGRTGGLEWSGQDSEKKWHDLATLKEPAVLFIGRDTLPLLKQSALWSRVKGVSGT